MKHISLYRAMFAVFLVAAGLALFYKHSTTAVAQTVTARPAPEFNQTDPAAWLNSPPLKMADLRGKVVLLDFWTFDCWNCYRSFPWLKSVEEQFAHEAFQVIGIHTPEFEHEKVRENVEAKIVEFGLDHPSMMDNDFHFWRSMRNRYWPTYYLIDKRGFIREVFIGETHKGDPRAVAIETAIKKLLAEPA